MNQNALSAGSAIVRDTTVDLSAAIGKTVNFSAGAPAVSASASVPVTGIVLDARTRTVTGNTTYDNSILLLGVGEVIYALISASAQPGNLGDELQQAADGTLTNDAGSGNARLIVGTCADRNGFNPGDLCAVLVHKPIARS